MFRSPYSLRIIGTGADMVNEVDWYWTTVRFTVYPCLASSIPVFTFMIADRY